MQQNQTNVLPKLHLTNSFYEYRKYKILQIIDNLPSYQCKLFKNELPKILDVNRQTFSNWLNARISDSLEIPSIKLAMIAKALNVPIEDLINVSIPAVIIKTETEKFQDSILKQTGLVN